ncbi:MAG: chemotaxis protein CheA [Planctomycetia bacterium]|nr:chemotaxis protein CheA [Planctomycetia bacterium]
MSDDRNSRSTKGLDVLQLIGLELAFVAPGVPSLPLVGLLDRLEEACGDECPEQIRAGLAAGRAWLGDPAGPSPATIALLNQWQPWMVEAVTAWQRQRPVAAVPSGWPVASGAPAPAPTSAAPVTGVPAGGPEDFQELKVLPDDADETLLQMFCSEAQDLLQEIEQSALVLETTPRDAATIDTVFRAFHTLKGNASVINLVVLQRLTHELESLLDLARRGQMELDRESIDLILEGADAIRRFVAEMAAQSAGAHVGRKLSLPFPRVIARVHSLISGERKPHPPTEPQAAPAASAAVVVPPPPAQPSVVEPPAGEPTAAGQPVAVAGPIPGVVKPASIAAPAAGPQAEPPLTPAPAGAAAMVRVDTLKLDGLIDLVGELVVAQSMVVQSPELRGIASAHLSRCLGQLRGITSDLQRTAMALRMVPIGGTFRKMTRLVRDVSLQLGKEIQLQFEGEETELDRTIVEELGDPLVHMIRNSADHGIESPAERIAAGKPAAGTITLRAFHQGGFIVIQIIDDGRGLDAGRIRAKAIERGLIQPQEALEPSAAYDLIFMPGFSTAEKVTGLSGRGVGMDVVRRNIEKIRGKVEVDSVLGRGTTFTMYVPLTLAIIEGLLVGVGDQRYIIPTLSVRESFRPLPGMVTTVHGRGELVGVRGRLTPLLRLGRHLNTPARAQDPSEGIVVVVESGQDCRCLLVDELIGKQEVVIKSLGEMFRDRTDFAGAAILGDGRVGLILDVNSLVKLKPRSGEAAA